jgi:hypothetical protein
VTERGNDGDVDRRSDGERRCRRPETDRRRSTPIQRGKADTGLDSPIPVEETRNTGWKHPTAGNVSGTVWKFPRWERERLRGGKERLRGGKEPLRRSRLRDSSVT